MPNNLALRLAAADIARVAATDPSRLVTFLDELRAELQAQRRTSRPFGRAADRLAWRLGEADEEYSRQVELTGAYGYPCHTLAYVIDMLWKRPTACLVYR